jgi:hypothetical protein
MIHRIKNNINNKNLNNREREGAKTRNQALEALKTAENLHRIIQNTNFV